MLYLPWFVTNSMLMGHIIDFRKKNTSSFPVFLSFCPSFFSTFCQILFFGSFKFYQTHYSKGHLRQVVVMDSAQESVRIIYFYKIIIIIIIIHMKRKRET